MGGHLQNKFNLYVATTLIILNLTGPIQANLCRPSVVKQSFVGSSRLALSRLILGSVLLALLPLSRAQGGTIREPGEPNPRSVVEFEPVATDYLTRDCRLGPDVMAASAVPGCTTTELRITRYIDHFYYQDDTLVRADAAKPSSFRAFPARVLGGERDVQVKRDSPAGVIESEILKPDPETKDTDMVHRQTEGNGNTLIVWDGPDGKPEIQTNGLEKVDFRQWNADRFVIRVSATDRSGSLIITVYDGNDKAKISQATIRYDDKKPREFSLLFDSLRPIGEKGRANLSTVGAVSLTIIPDVVEGQPNASTRIDFIALAGPQCIPCAGNDGPSSPGGGLCTFPPSGGNGFVTGGNYISDFPIPPGPWLPLFFPGGGGGPNVPPNLPPPQYPPICDHPQHPPDCGPPPVPEPGSLTITVMGVISIGGYRFVKYLQRRI